MGTGLDLVNPGIVRIDDARKGSGRSIFDSHCLKPGLKIEKGCWIAEQQEIRKHEEKIDDADGAVHS